MPDEHRMGLERDTAEIVSAYLRHHQLSADQVGSLIQSVHAALSNLEKPEPEKEVERTPAVPIRRSVVAKQFGLGRRAQVGAEQASPDPQPPPEPKKRPSRRGRQQSSAAT